MEYSSGAAEAYRYHHSSSYDAFGGQTNAYCGNGNGLPPPASDGGVHLGMVANPARRFHPYLSSNGDHHLPLAPVPGSELNGNFTSGFSSGQHQCDQCSAVCDSPHSLSEHMQAHHFVFNDSYAPSSAHVKTELNGGSGSETAEILDLDSHKVHVYQPPGSVLGVATIPFHSINGGLAPTPPYTPAASVGSASNSSSVGWMTPTPPLAPPPPLHPQEYRANSFPSYEVPNAVNGNNGNNGIVAPAIKSSNGWKPNPPPTGGGGPPGVNNGGSGSTGSSHGGGSEARRPKTYNCEACNKWFTSSGHLKRHYNTTLHKNAVKSSGGGAGTNGVASNDRRSTTPSSRSATTPVGAINSPAEPSDEINNKTMDDTSTATQPSPKSAVPPSPNHINSDYRPPSQHQQSPLVLPSHQQQQQLQHSQVPPQLQSVSSPSYSTAPHHYQQQPQQSNQVLDPYRSPYPTNIPVSNPAVMQMQTGVPSPGPAPPQSNHMNYNYGPPSAVHPNYPPVYSQHPVLPPSQQQQQQQHIYPQSNTFSYPPNSIAPPLSSSNVNGQQQQLGVGPSASQHDIVQSHSANQQLPQYHQHSNQEQHMQQQQPYLLNNNNIIDHHHNKVGGGGGGGDDTENFVMKSQDSDCSDGGGVSEGSPVGSEDAEMDASDVDETDQMVKLAPSIDFPTAAPVTGSKVTKRSNGTTVQSSGGSTAAVGSFKCTQCDKAFNRVCYLTQHNNTFHKGDKPFKCHMCGKRFPNAELFDQHQQKHAGDKPYKCPLCPKQFNHKTDLRRHMCLHTGQKPFMCQVCNKGFIRKDHMVKHVQTHTRRNALHTQPPPPPAAASL